MEFWNVGVKPRIPKKVNLDKGSILMLSEASLGMSRKRTRRRSISLFAKVGDRKIVLGTILAENTTTMYFHLPFQEEIELSHDWPFGFVNFSGYKFIPSSKELTWNSDYAILSKRRKVSVPIAEPLLPHDIFFEILSWLPAKCLAKCKCVCKEWYSLIDDRCFLFHHLNRATLAAIDSQNDIKIGDVNIGGLIFEKISLSGKYQIRNPITRRILDLPDPPKDIFDRTFCLGGIPSQDFTLVTLYNDRTKNGVEACAVLRIEKDIDWRSLKLPNSWECGRKLKGVMVHPESGVVHYVKTNVDESNYFTYVYSLDLGTQCFFRTILSQGVLSNPRKSQAFYWNNCLAVSEIVEEVIQVLVLEDYKKQRWSEKTIISPFAFLKDSDYKKERLSLVEYCAESDNLTFYYRDKYLTYNIKLGKIPRERSLPFSEKNKPCYHILPSLITLSGMRPE